MALAEIKRFVYEASLIILAVMLMLCLLRAVLGPRVSDRIVAVNMMGTMVMVKNATARRVLSFISPILLCHDTV
mgnify:CR=1 FL=1